MTGCGSRNARHLWTEPSLPQPRRRSGTPRSGEPGTHNHKSLGSKPRPKRMEPGLRLTAGPGMTHCGFGDTRHLCAERSCMDGPLSARSFSSFRQADQACHHVLRACLRGAWTAGPREYEVGLQDHLYARARGAMTFAECPDPVSDRFAVTSKLPLRSWTRLRGPQTQIRGVDAQSIHTLFIGQPCRLSSSGRLLVWLSRGQRCRAAVLAPDQSPPRR